MACTSVNYSKYEKFEKIDLIPVLKNTVSYYRWYASGRDIIVSFDKVHCNTNVVCSRFLMEQVFNNLLHNAIKYSFTGRKVEGRMRYVNIKVYSEQNYYLCISFENYGIGILEREFSKIHDIFYRGRKVKDERRTGTGIGLSIVKEIVEIHKGKMVVKSVPLHIRKTGTRKFSEESEAHFNSFVVKIPYYREESF